MAVGSLAVPPAVGGRVPGRPRKHGLSGITSLASASLQVDDVAHAPGHGLINPVLQTVRRCPLHSESDRMAATARNVAMGQSRHFARSKQRRYSITSSAVNSSFDGISRPRILAVFRLITR